MTSFGPDADSTHRDVLERRRGGMIRTSSCPMRGMALRLSRRLIARRFSPVYADSEVVLFSARVLRARAQTVTCALVCTRTHARNRARTRKRAPACTRMNASTGTCTHGPFARARGDLGGAGGRSKGGYDDGAGALLAAPPSTGTMASAGCPTFTESSTGNGSMLGNPRVEADSMHKEPLCRCLLRATRLHRNKKLDGSNAQAGLRSSRRPIAAAACH